FFQAEDGIREFHVTGVQTCALPIFNLLDNAARHGPPGSDVRVSAHEEGDELVLEVRDEGPGIPPEERTRVFHRFTRGERAGGGRSEERRVGRGGRARWRAGGEAA